MFQRIPAIEKIEAAIGWSPSVSLEQILTEVVADVSSRRTAGELSVADPGP
jgi:nucleoside-diphosphate-sugar epimerase